MCCFKTSKILCNIKMCVSCRIISGLRVSEGAAAAAAAMVNVEKWIVCEMMRE